jgi:hypothetical protein
MIKLMLGLGFIFNDSGHAMGKDTLLVRTWPARKLKCFRWRRSRKC